MKLKTKLKVLHWVKKLLWYNETKEPVPFLEIETKRITVLKYEQLFSEKDLLMIDKEQLKFVFMRALVNHLTDVEAIKYTREPSMSDAHIRITGKILIILPTHDSSSRNP
jgi:hypothetical protein